MNDALNTVRQRLLDGEYTCVVRSGDKEYTSYERGVKPLLELLKAECSFAGAVAADKTVGAGAAHLYVLLGIKVLWANVISESAMTILKNNGIEVCYGDLVPYIINRQGNGICPIESAVAGAKTSAQAYELIIAALARLQNAQRHV